VKSILVDGQLLKNNIVPATSGHHKVEVIMG
jgi:hypothetical protein